MSIITWVKSLLFVQPAPSAPTSSPYRPINSGNSQREIVSAREIPSTPAISTPASVPTSRQYQQVKTRANAVKPQPQSSSSGASSSRRNYSGYRYTGGSWYDPFGNIVDDLILFGIYNNMLNSTLAVNAYGYAITDEFGNPVYVSPSGQTFDSYGNSVGVSGSIYDPNSYTPIDPGNTLLDLPGSPQTITVTEPAYDSSAVMSGGNDQLPQPDALPSDPAPISDQSYIDPLPQPAPDPEPAYSAPEPSCDSSSSYDSGSSGGGSDY